MLNEICIFAYSFELQTMNFLIDHYLHLKHGGNRNTKICSIK